MNFVNTEFFQLTIICLKFIFFKFTMRDNKEYKILHLKITNFVYLIKNYDLESNLLYTVYTKKINFGKLENYFE